MGYFGGCEPEDDSRRTYVPGPVAVMDEDGKIVSGRSAGCPQPDRLHPGDPLRGEFRELLEYG